MISDLLGLPKAQSLEHPETSLSDPAALDALFEGPRQPSGVAVDESSAVNVLVASLCMRIIAETTAGLPLGVFEHDEDRRRPLHRHRIRRLLDGSPNPEMNAHTFRETLGGHLLSWGNCYAEKEFTAGGDLLHLWPLPPHRVRIERIRGRKVFIVRTGGKALALEPEQVWHVPWWSPDGIRGYSPVRQAASALGLAQALDVFAQRFFGAGAYMSGFVTHPLRLQPQTRDHLRQQLESMHTGLGRSHRIAILDEGMDWKTANMPLEEAQVLQSRAFQASQVAGFYRVTPDRVNIFEKAATYGSLDATEIRHVKDAIMPFCERFEASIDHQLLERWERWDDDEPEVYVKHNLSAVLRGDPLKRAEVQSILRLAGILNGNEIRAQEDLNPQPGEQGEIYYVPENLRPADLPYPEHRTYRGGAAETLTPDPSPLPPSTRTQGEGRPHPPWPPSGEGAGGVRVSMIPLDELEERAEQALRRTLHAGFARLVTFEARAVERRSAAARRRGDDPTEAVATWYRDKLHLDTVTRELEPPLLAWAELIGHPGPAAEEAVRRHARDRAELYLQIRTRQAQIPDESSVELAVDHETRAARERLRPRLHGATEREDRGR